jgi:hypothetical protein
MTNYYSYHTFSDSWSVIQFNNNEEVDAEVAYFPPNHNVEYIVELLNEAYRKGMESNEIQ